MANWTEEQLQAINTDNSNIIVSAGAGSGKTAVLSQRVIRKLKQGTHINELLILTFTNQAANEMKNRIRKEIKKENLKEELDLIDSAYITTFDSFALSIVRKYHYVLNLPKDINIIDSTIIEIKKKEIMDQIFEKYYESNNQKFLNIINDFCIKDDKNIKKSIMDISKNLDLLPNKKDILDSYITTNFNEEKIKKDIEKYILFIQQRINDIKKYLLDLKAYCDVDYYDRLVNSLDLLIQSETYDEIKQNISINIPKIPRGSTNELKKLKNDISTKIDEIKSLVKYQNEDDIKDTIMSTKNTVQIIIEIIKQYDSEIEKYKLANNSFEFLDITLLLIKLIKNNEDIQKEIRSSFKEIMVDEYQDTSDVQEEFINLIQNNNVYMVGDIKQSIYRFRNANPYIFKNKYDNYSLKKNGIKIDLNKNFRSRKEVLDNINKIFNDVMDDNIGGADYRQNHQMIFGNKDYDLIGKTNQNNDMEIYSYKYDKDNLFSKEEIEAFIIANDIKNKIDSNYQIYDKDNKVIRNINYSDFVILIDRTSSFEIYKKIFEYMHIPISMLKDYKLNDGTDINLIKNIIGIIIKVKQNLYDTEFKYYFISIMRSFLYNEKDDVIFDYFINNNYKESDLVKRVLKIIENIDIMSNLNIIETIIDEFNFYENIIKTNNIDEKISKIDIIKEMFESLSNLGYNIYDLKEYLEKIIEENYDKKYNIDLSENNSVTIMTIHKSKGLEYHICYYAGLYKNFNISDLKERFLYDNSLGIIVPYFKNGIGETIYKEMLKDKYIKEEISEKIRLFYVALTRAKEKMILLNVQEEKDNYNMDKLKYRSFKDILDSINSNIEKYYININDVNLTKDYLIKQNVDLNNIIPTSNQILEVKELKLENEILKNKKFSKQLSKLMSSDEKENIEFGKKMHYLLEMLDLKQPNLDLIENSYEKSLIQKFLKQKIFQNIKNCNIYKEYEFMYQENNIFYNGVIDLMIEHENYIDIIDYKLKNIKDSNYIKQLTGYKKYIAKISNKKVNIYLYSILDGKIENIEENNVIYETI